MKVILIQGTEGIGKTTLCNEIEKYLLEQRIVDDYDKYGDFKGDFVGVYTKREEGIKILINSWSDTEECISNFSEAYEEKKPFDVVITAIRPKDVNPKIHQWVRDVFEKDSVDEILIDLDTLASKYTTRETFAKDVLKNEFLPMFNAINKK